MVQIYSKILNKHPLFCCDLVFICFISIFFIIFVAKVSSQMFHLSIYFFNFAVKKRVIGPLREATY